MSSIRKCFEHAKAVLEGKIEAPLEDVKDIIRIIEETLKYKGPCYFRCCNEMETREGITYIHCDSSPDMPLTEFKGYCNNCAKEIRQQMPYLKKQLKKS
ncbi:MAG: hypothetical protein KJ955_05865 [Nanoarchaeota archaeon]|nr:hypothetical protein [Nanoarchaeota archaeon]